MIFGETGVGKSSLINLIANEKIAETSSNAVGCTLDYKRYSLKIEDQHFAIWDTAGLDEGTQGTVPAEKAEAYLKQLLHDLAKASSVDLLIYCVRGTRVRSALLANYHLFYSAICRKKVPIAIVITGLENQEGNMDTWWLQNEKHFSALRMHFSSYACVTTLRSSTENPILEQRRRISRAAVNKMIISTCRTERWMPTERSWINTVFSDIHGMLSPREGQGTHVPIVIMCDTSRSGPVGPGVIKRSVTFQSPFTLSRSFTCPMSLRNPVLIANGRSQSKLPFDEAIKCTPERLFRVYQVPRRESASMDLDEETKKDVAVKRGADLLIFCAEKGGERSHINSQWEYFNLTYGGDLSPRIVVVVGATDPGSAEEWWRDTVGGTFTKSDASITYWPGNKTAAGAEAAEEQLRDLINTCCIDCSKVSFARDDSDIFKEISPRLDKARITMSLWKLPTSNAGKPDRSPTVVDQDVLTKWRVWEHVEVTTTRLNFQ